MPNIYDKMQSLDDYCSTAKESYIEVFDDATGETLVHGRPDYIRRSDYVDYRIVSVNKYEFVTIIYARCPW